MERLRTAVGIEESFQAQGVAEESFIGRLEELAMAAYGDQCAPANPRMPLLADMRTLMEAAYYGTSFAAVRAQRAQAQVAADAAVAAAAVETTGADEAPAAGAAPGRKKANS